jgi:transcriptional regulator with XRE-family HTH domain
MVVYYKHMNAKVEDSQKALYIELGKKIKNARGTRSQAELAKASSLSRTSITNIEKGRQHLPLHTLYSIANALEIPITELLPDQNKFADNAFLDNIPDDIHPEAIEWIKEVASSTTKKDKKR